MNFNNPSFEIRSLTPHHINETHNIIYPKNRQLGISDAANMWGTRGSHSEIKYLKGRMSFKSIESNYVALCIATTQLQLSNYHVIAENNHGKQITGDSDILCES